METRFLVLPLSLFAFRGLSGAPAAALTAPVVVDTTSFAASTVALAASVTVSCADFAASMVVLGRMEGTTRRFAVVLKAPSAVSAR